MDTSEQFASLSEYLRMSQKMLMFFGKRLNINKDMLSKLSKDDEVIGEIAAQLMTADWEWQEDKGSKKGTWRLIKAKYVIQNILNKKQKAKNQNYSLDACFAVNEENNEIGLLDMLPDKKAKEPIDYIEPDNVAIIQRNYLKTLIESSGLTENQKKCIDLIYFQGLDKKQAMQHFNPPLSKIQIHSMLTAGLRKMRISATGKSEHVASK